jgi:hypothetical protein
MALDRTPSGPSWLIVVKIAYDEEANVWYVLHSDVPGLRAEADTADELINRIPPMLADLIEENGFNEHSLEGVNEVPVEIIASHSTRVRLHEAA